MTSPLHAQSVLAGRISSVIQQSINSQRRYTETLSEQAVRDGACLGFVELEGSGEAIVDIEFPLRFLERPLFTAGLELRDNQWLTWGAFPTWSATVSKWVTETAGETRLYVGAALAVVTFNADRADLHYSFKARSLTSPSGPPTSVGSTM